MSKILCLSKSFKRCISFQEHARRILGYQVPGDPKFELDDDIVDAIDSLWNDKTVGECVEERRHEFYLMDSAP